MASVSGGMQEEWRKDVEKVEEYRREKGGGNGARA